MKHLEIRYCIECPHCNSYFLCAPLGRKVDEIPDDCPLVEYESLEDRTKRQDLEKHICLLMQENANLRTWINGNPRALYQVTEIPPDPKDTERLNFIEERARRSRTGVSFDFARPLEGEAGGIRFMHFRVLYGRKKDIRGAIDEAMANELK